MNFIVLGKSRAMLAMLIDNIYSTVPRTEEVVIKVVNNLSTPVFEDDYKYIYDKTRFVIMEIGVDELITLPIEKQYVLLGVNKPNTKKQLLGECIITPGNSIHASASLSPLTEIGVGFFASSQITVAGGAKIGDFVGINRNASVGHHTEVGDYVSINPGAVICGNCKIGAGTLIGAGAVIKDGITIGENCVIGAGSNVLSNVPAHSIGWGNPFQIKIKK